MSYLHSIDYLPGVILPWGGDTVVPNGWVQCNGALYSPTKKISNLAVSPSVTIWNPGDHIYLDSQFEVTECTPFNLSDLTDFTFELFVYDPGTSLQKDWCGQYLNSSNYMKIRESYDWNPKYSFTGRFFSFSWATSGTTHVTLYSRETTPNTRMHICIMKIGSTCYLFRDGILDDSATISGTPSTFVSSFLTNISRNSYSHYYLDELRISSVARYSSSGFTPPASDFTTDASTIMYIPVSIGESGQTQLNNDIIETYQYHALYTSITTRFGTSGSGTFRVPDMRGAFLRGSTDIGSSLPGGSSCPGCDPYPRCSVNGGAASGIGSFQIDDYAPHTHQFHGLYCVRFRCYSGINVGAAGPYGTNYGTTGALGGIAGSENRPKNIATHWIIKL